MSAACFPGCVGQVFWNGGIAGSVNFLHSSQGDITLKANQLSLGSGPEDPGPLGKEEYAVSSVQPLSSPAVLVHSGYYNRT